MNKLDITEINKHTQAINTYLENGNKSKNTIKKLLGPLDKLFSDKPKVENNIYETIENKLNTINLTFDDELGDLCESIKICSVYCKAKSILGEYCDENDDEFVMNLLSKILMSDACALNDLFYQFSDNIRGEQIKILQDAINKLKDGYDLDLDDGCIDLSGEATGSELYNITCVFMKNATEIITSLVNDIFTLS